MGLELGPPWLVIALPSGDGSFQVIYRDNFTGAALRRAISVRKGEPSSFAAVMDKYGNFATLGDGSRFDPLEGTKGRHGGTDADRAYKAYLIAQKAFSSNFRHLEAKKASRQGNLSWLLKVVSVLVVLISIGWIVNAVSPN